MNYSLSLTINQRELIEEMYLAYQLEAKIKNVVFRALKDDVTITLYTNNNLFLEGPYKNELKRIKERLGLRDFSAIGSDEVGTGDLFGPIVVCSTFVPKEMIETLEDL
ncbi:MAG: ribonuclease HIII, partial [Acholeplasmataceae bacterium]|nr:ribonuclease HIII [Acholeplasmataceae bacterium]